METYISLHHFDSKDEAMAAAIAFKKENGGTIVENCIGEDTDDSGKIVGVYRFVAIVKGYSEDNPAGDSYKEFPYDYKAL